MARKNDVIILFSGGYDSTLLVSMAQKMGLNPLCLLFDYGQKHKEELKIAAKVVVDCGLDHKILTLPLRASSKLTDGRKVYEGVSEWHVPGRNLMFISTAVSIAESEGIDLIWYGANYEDRVNLFPDCYQEWVHQLNTLLERNGSFPIRVEAPLLGMTKRTIELFGVENFGIVKEETFSGYGEIK